MKLKKIIFSITALLFLAGALFIVPQAALANGSDWSKKMPPGQAKKMLEQDDWVHPSVKGLKNAYRNLYHNGAPEWKLNKFEQKIMHRGGNLEDIDGIGEKEYTISVDGDSNIKLYFGQDPVDIRFLVEDSEANAADLPENYEMILQVSDDDSVVSTNPQDGDIVELDRDGFTKAITVTANDDEEDGTATIKVTLYNDQDEAVDSATITVTVGERAATNGTLSSGYSDLTFTSDANEGSAYVAKAGDEYEISFYYHITDQAGNSFDVTEDIIWTVENTGENDIYVNWDTVQPGEEKEFTKEISDDDFDRIQIKADDVTEVKISAQIEENDDSLDTTGIIFYDEDNELDSDSNETIEGTVKAFAFGNSDDETQVLLENGDDYYYIWATFENVTIEDVDGNTINGDEDELEDYLEYDMEVVIELDDKDEDDNSDEDSISLYLN